MLAREKEEEGNLGDVEMGRGHLVVGEGEGEGDWRGNEGKGFGGRFGTGLGGTARILSKGTKTEKRQRTMKI